MNYNGGDYINNNESIIIKCKIDSKYHNVLKKILELNKMTQQEFFEKKIKEYILSNIELLFENSKGSK